ncbi:MAG: signal peptidase I [Christensenellaceae bacterium]
MWQNGYDNLIMQREKERNRNKYANIFLCSLAFFLIVLIILKTVVFSSVVVDGSSMENTLFDGDILIVNKLKKPERGDVVIFYIADIDENGNINYRYDANGKKIMYVKRVIGEPQDSVYWIDGNVYVEYSNNEGLVTIKLNEPYVKGGTYSGYRGDKTRDEATVVDENKYFVLGDNREVSVDSRIIGCVDERLIVGVVDDFVIQHKNNLFWKTIYKMV